MHREGDDSGSPLTLTTNEIGEKFIQYYWRQAIPYAAGSKARVLQQNTGKQAAVVNVVRAARERHGDSLAAVMKQTPVCPVTVSWQSFDLLAGPSPSRQISFERKKNTPLWRRPF